MKLFSLSRGHDSSLFNQPELLRLLMQVTFMLLAKRLFSIIPSVTKKNCWNLQNFRNMFGRCILCGMQGSYLGHHPVGYFDVRLSSLVLQWLDQRLTLVVLKFAASQCTFSI